MEDASTVPPEAIDAMCSLSSAPRRVAREETVNSGIPQQVLALIGDVYPLAGIDKRNTESALDATVRSSHGFDSASWEYIAQVGSLDPVLWDHYYALESEFDAGAGRTDSVYPDDYADYEDYYITGGSEMDFNSSKFKVDVSYRNRDTRSYSSGDWGYSWTTC